MQLLKKIRRQKIVMQQIKTMLRKMYMFTLASFREIILGRLSTSYAGTLNDCQGERVNRHVHE